MNGPWLLIDAHYLAHRNFHALGDLTDPDGVRTATVYGVFRDVIELLHTFGTDRVAFCWDARTSLRKQIYPDYKANREVKPEEVEARAELYRQIDLLRDDYIPRMGYQNNFYAEGYEADDLIAAACKGVLLGNAFHGATQDRVVIVSSDADLFQLLHPVVSIYNPRKKVTLTLESYQWQWNLTPDDWPHVKAIAGCGTDNVEGVEGVAELTASRYVNGTLTKTLKSGKPNKAYAAIEGAAGQAIWRRNLELVTLPFKGCPQLTLADDNVPPERWVKMAAKLGFNSLV